MQIGARTDDPARDVSDTVRSAVLDRLSAAGLAEDTLKPLRDVMPAGRLDPGQAFGEAVPVGLRLAH